MHLQPLFTKRFSAYTLACRELLLAFDDRDSQVDEVQGGSGVCIGVLDTAFKRAFGYADEQSFAHEFALQLAHEARTTGDPVTVAIFTEVIARFQAGIGTWDPVAHMVELHNTGRILARDLMSQSQSPVVQNRLGVVCPVHIRYNKDVVRLGEIVPPAKRDTTPPCIAYNPPYNAPVGDLELLFSANSNFTLYLALPYLFMHEYASHVFATDYDSEWFNDGWLIFAQARHLEVNWDKPGLPMQLSIRQGTVHPNKLRATLTGHPDSGYALAQEMWALLGPESGIWISMELAAYQSLPGESDTWQTTFLREVSRVRRVNRRQLPRLVNGCPDIRTLLTRLKTI